MKSVALLLAGCLVFWCPAAAQEHEEEREVREHDAVEHVEQNVEEGEHAELERRRAREELEEHVEAAEREIRAHLQALEEVRGALREARERGEAADVERLERESEAMSRQVERMRRDLEDFLGAREREVRHRDVAAQLDELREALGHAEEHGNEDAAHDLRERIEQLERELREIESAHAREDREAREEGPPVRELLDRLRDAENEAREAAEHGHQDASARLRREAAELRERLAMHRDRVAREIEERIRHLEERFHEAAERGHDEEARELQRGIVELQRELERNRPRRAERDPEIAPEARELAQHLMARAREAAAQGRGDEFREILAQVEEIRRRFGAPPERPGARGEGAPSPAEDAPVEALLDEMARLRRAAIAARRRGAHEDAEHQWNMANELLRKLERHIHGEPGPAPRNREPLRPDARREAPPSDALWREVDRLRAEVRELRRLLQDALEERRR